MRFAMLALAAAALFPGLAATVQAQAVSTPSDLKHFDVTIVRFDPATGPRGGQAFVLPVDSPDEEHAIASTIANAASWPGKAAAGRPLPVAFMAVRVSQR